MRSDLIESDKIMDSTIFIRIYFFQLDDGGSRGHDQKLFKRRFRLDIRKYAFCNRVIELLITGTCYLQKHLSPELESGAV